MCVPDLPDTIASKVDENCVKKLRYDIHAWSPKMKQNWKKYMKPIYDNIPSEEARSLFLQTFRPKIRGEGMTTWGYVSVKTENEYYVKNKWDEFFDGMYVNRNDDGDSSIYAEASEDQSLNDKWSEIRHGGILSIENPELVLKKTYALYGNPSVFSSCDLDWLINEYIQNVNNDVFPDSLFVARSLYQFARDSGKDVEQLREQFDEYISGEREWNSVKNFVLENKN